MERLFAGDEDLTGKCYSFDVFDTVLTRAVCPPESVFVLAAKVAHEHLPSGFTPEQFVHHRERADARARSWHGHNKTLDDIYSELRESLDLPESNLRGLKAAELSAERRVLYPVPGIRSALDSLRARGADIVFTSDMYLPSEYLRARLQEHDIWRRGDRLFVSCEYGFQKSGGRLFGPVLQTVQRGAKDTVHVGNCRYADVKGAEWAGIQPVHFDQANPNRYERILANHAPRTGGLTGYMSGASRYARLHTPVSSNHERALRDVTAGVMAPLLTGFVLWILKKAHAHRIERLYFTSRDGQALIPIARQLADILHIGCSCKYVYLSRTSLAAANPDADVLLRMLEYETASAEELLSRYGLKIEEILPYLPSGNALTHIRSQPLSEKGKQIIANAIVQLRNDAHVQAKIDENRSLLRFYLTQEGLHEAGRFGFVDIGWKGSVHSLLSDFLQQEKMRKRPLPAFLFGLSTPQQPHAINRQAYLFDEGRKLGYRNVLHPGSAIFTVMEVFCTADHGTVTGYRTNGEAVIPTLESTWRERMLEWGLPVVRRTLDAFVDGLTDYADGLSDRANARDAFMELLTTFWHDPSSAEAHAWGAFPREIGQGDETTVKPLAPPNHWTSLPQYARHGSQAHQHIGHRFSWPQGALVRSSFALQSSIDLTLRIRRRLIRMARKVHDRMPS